MTKVRYGRSSEIKIAVRGTGMVGDAIGSKLVVLGHDVRMGSRSATNNKATDWVKKTGAKASHGTFADAAAFGEILFNCTNGVASLRGAKCCRCREPQRQDRHRRVQPARPSR